MKKISVNVEFIYELKTKQDWINKVPSVLPNKAPGENFLFIDAADNVLVTGEDFAVAENEALYPVKIYLPIRTKDYMQKIIHNPVICDTENISKDRTWCYAGDDLVEIERVLIHYQNHMRMMVDGNQIELRCTGDVKSLKHQAYKSEKWHINVSELSGKEIYVHTPTNLIVSFKTEE